MQTVLLYLLCHVKCVYTSKFKCCYIFLNKIFSCPPSESAGSTSAGYHMLSPLSRGLFNRVILQVNSDSVDIWTFRGAFKRSSHHVPSS